MLFFFSSRRRHTRLQGDWSSDVCSSDLISEVPATSEIVLEGHVHLDELRTEGPFGDHTGFYSLEDLYPVFHLSCITHRKNPIYATTIVGKPPKIGRASCRERV